MADTPHNEHSVQIEHEKTKRAYAYLGVFGVMGLVAIVLFYMNVGQGSLKVSTDGIEVTVDQPLIEQVSAEERTITINGDTVAMTTGTVPDSIVEQIQAERPTTLPTDAFVGKNLIDRTQGFVVSSDRPDLWKADPSLLRSSAPNVLALNTQGGSRLTVDTVPRSTCRDLNCVIRIVSRSAVTGATVDKDERALVAVVTFADRLQRTVVVKCLRQDDHWVTVRGEIAAGASAMERKDVIKTVTTFSLIAKR